MVLFLYIGGSGLCGFWPDSWVGLFGVLVKGKLFGVFTWGKCGKLCVFVWGICISGEQKCPSSDGQAGVFG